MLRLPHLLLPLALLAWLLPYAKAEEKPPTPEQEQFFEKKIRPVLVGNCFECHSDKKQESNFRLDSRAALLEGGVSGQRGAVAGQPDKSQLVKAIHHLGDIKMPPEKRLTDTEIADISKWVEMGLPWPKSAEIAKPLSAEERAAHARKSLWSLQSVHRPAIPDVSKAEWVNTPVDAFILARLDAAKLSPSPEVDRRTLLRRASFDLLGLPPTPEEVAGFVSDTSPDAYEKLIDRLLASPRYGERWGRHWLDVARYGDTKGYSFMQERKYPFSYTYRDYVIGAFNKDLPYDRFIVEQLAADKLPLGEDKTPLAAMGFLTTGRKFNNHHDDIDDQIDVVSRGLLGMTVACARCHDHKYDAIPTDDYYSLFGVFDSSQQPGELPLIGEAKQSQEYQAYEKELAGKQKELTDFDAKVHATLVEKTRKQPADYLTRALFEENELQVFKALSFLSDNAKDLRRKLIERWRDYLKQNARPENASLGLWWELAALPAEGFEEKAAAVLTKWKGLPDGMAGGQCNPRVKAAFAADALKIKPDVARIYGKLLADAHEEWLKAGGNEEAFGKLPEDARQLAQIIAGKDSPTNVPLADIQQFFSRDERQKRGEIKRKVDSFQANSPVAPPRAMVLNDTPTPHEPHVLIRGNPGRPGKRVPRQFLLVVAGQERTPFKDGSSGRLDLANSITSAGNPLTRRVIANRFWMHHFGEPLVTTPSDFGIRSDLPTHPELLDYLASSLLDSGWSLKSLHRKLLLSSTYRQASVDRPDCRAIDSENRLLWRMNRRRLELEATRDMLLSAADRLDTQMGGRPVDLTAANYSRRRAVYGFIDRQDLPGMFRVFDIASPDQSSARRSRTTIPQQALFLMNSPFVVDQSRALAARPDVASLSDPAARITRLYEILFSRQPLPDEVEIGRQFIESAGNAVADSSVRLSPWEQYCQLLLLTNEGMYID
ncbi:MAG: PSD1 and planctomycete cytochrome C domain-containing protein [Pirellulaceae bacterium]